MTHDQGRNINRLAARITKPGSNASPAKPNAHGETRQDLGFHELENRLLLSASGIGDLDKQPISDLDAWLNQPVAMVDQSHDDDHEDGIHGIVDPDDDHGNNAADSTFVQTDTTLIGDIEIAADQDWFHFQGQTGIQYTFATELLELSDTSLVLYDTDGVSVLAFDDDGGPGLASLLNWTAPSQGTYYIAVRGFDVQTGSYSISMTDTAIPTGEIRGTKWDDIDQDGIHDENEPGLEGWMMFIDTNRNRKRDSGERFVFTDANGDYVFENMRAGVYTVAERAEPGWQQTFPGDDGATISTNPPPGVVEVSTGSDPIDFTVPGDKWPQPDGLGSTVVITYSYSNLLDGGLPGGLSASAIRAAIEEALDLWAGFAPLKFVEVDDSGPAPSDIPYGAADHPDIRFGHHDIDGDSGVLAHAYLPETGGGLDGDVHFDNGDTWSIGPGGTTIDLIEVAVHEIGHSLGLLHEESGIDAIMNPIYGERYDGFETSFLLDDDVAGIQSLYGEVQSLLGVWTVTINNPGEIAEGVDFGSFLNDDHGNEMADASSVDAPNFISGNIESFGDVDWFSFEAGQGQSFSFETLLGGGDIEDTVIRLFDQDGNSLLDGDDDSGIALASKLPWVAPSPGTYFIEVSGFAANIGDYTLRLAAAPVGDINVDGFVGVGDLQIILANWNQNVPVGDLAFGDLSFDGFIGIDDLNLVLGNWNSGESSTAPAQQASADESTAPQSETSVAATTTQQRTRPARVAQAQPRQQQQVQQSQQTQNAIAAWSRQTAASVQFAPALSLSNASDSDDSEGLLGLWTDDADA